MKTLLSLAAVLALTSPALAQSDSEFSSALNLIRDIAAKRTQAAKSQPRFQLTTQETGPNDPLLLAQKPLIDLIKKVEPSVVFLSMTIPGEDASQKPGHAICTGFFVDAMKELGRPSVIATNAHCVQKLAVGAEIEVGLQTGNDNRPKMVKGRVLAYGDARMAKDIAFVELVDKSLDRRPLPVWTKLDKGETVVAIGSPRGMTFSVTKGIVSALGRDRLGDEFVLDQNQSDAAINPGNSGGPLFNMWGSVVGINSMIASQSGGFEGIGLSLPAGYITLAMKQYKRTGNLKPSAIQLEVSASTTTNSLTAGKASPGGPADAAGIQPGDELVQVDDVRLDGLLPEDALKAFLTHVKYRSPGEKLSVTVRRGGKVSMLSVTTAEAKPPEPARPEWAPIPPNRRSSRRASSRSRPSALTGRRSGAMLGGA
ncbi:MAG: trypsin-like peptidase domain-containing protein [Elusimicrobiota bacterium]|nr:MAG: trypsin-like peptidase domain-containing protein [Elusimicrobiota bacterium]